MLSTVLRTTVTRSASRFSMPAVRAMSSHFAPSHEFAQVDGSIAKIGITDFAQAALGDIVFVDLPEVGDDVEKGESFGSVESVKAASDVYSPVSGVVTEVNEVLSDEPGTVNTAAESDGWFIKVEMSDTSELGDLMDPDAYQKHCDESS
ncbi:hypothetical protein TrLO_g13298 [Triparma laevis f. longispina]|uniref:Glycine cleavage system H protein n=1 Tax=Triparma laevis f. longispina TaxID=1714387 RepID=A0A9W7FGP4_9STRA|nr:hypothetical protein TrLO_g13298 [Triparma laevis f. longispina]